MSHDIYISFWIIIDYYAFLFEGFPQLHGKKRFEHLTPRDAKDNFLYGD